MSTKVSELVRFIIYLEKLHYIYISPLGVDFFAKKGTSSYSDPHGSSTNHKGFLVSQF